MFYCLSEMKKQISGWIPAFNALPSVCDPCGGTPDTGDVTSACIFAAVSNRFRDTRKGLVFPNITNLCPEILCVLQLLVSYNK